MKARSQYGFTYVALLIIIALLGVGLAAKGMAWHGSSQRDKEAELLFIGEEFREAIALYYYRTPGQVHEYPRSLNELLEDSRFQGTQRYLRRIYRDPMTRSAQWGVVFTTDGRVKGVHSLSKDQPQKTGNFSEINKEFSNKHTYAEWRFVFEPVAFALNSPPSKAP